MYLPVEPGRLIEGPVNRGPENRGCTVHRAQSVTLLWLAYRIGVVQQCCQVLKYNTMFYKNGVILHACAHGRRNDFFQWGH